MSKFQVLHSSTDAVPGGNGGAEGTGSFPKPERFSIGFPYRATNPVIIMAIIHPTGTPTRPSSNRGLRVIDVRESLFLGAHELNRPVLSPPLFTNGEPRHREVKLKKSVADPRTEP